MLNIILFPLKLSFVAQERYFVRIPYFFFLFSLSQSLLFRPFPLRFLCHPHVARARESCKATICAALKTIFNKFQFRFSFYSFSFFHRWNFFCAQYYSIWLGTTEGAIESSLIYWNRFLTFENFYSCFSLTLSPTPPDCCVRIRIQLRKKKCFSPIEIQNSEWNFIFFGSGLTARRA